ncbi:hypothetical protein [Alishewanella tabrizica]|uniref:Uncharacterized protein n=1 Tax=Alishewanella tabrizica TaxID=671278 RepID=A0ABQ2WH38_9ALTE|nr:hypothetical protein [Alishewanella tabrizica]GGW52729.1 hypothetical protein GCM10008111_06000 [Alishewanella tabrizica]
MNRTLVIILLVAVGIYCLPTILAIIAGIFALAIGLVGAILGVGITLLVTLGPILLVGYLIWWLVRDNRRQRQY